MKKIILGFCFWLLGTGVALAEDGYEWGYDENGQYILINNMRIYGVERNKVKIVPDARKKSVPDSGSKKRGRRGNANWNIDELVTSNSGNEWSVDSLNVGQSAASTSVTSRPASTSKPVPRNSVQAGYQYPGATKLSPFGPENKFLMYYNRLNDDEKKLYETLYFALVNRRESVVFGHTIENEQRIFHAVLADHPEVFWTENRYTLSVNPDNPNSAMEFEFKYYEFPGGLNGAIAELESAADQILTGARQFTTDAEKEKYVYDLLVKNTEYQKGCDYRHSIYSVLAEHVALCEGFSRTFQYLMLRLGIPATYLPGHDGSAEHSWNQVIIGGKCYNVDVTNGSHDPGSGWKIDERVATYRRYNLSDRELKELGYLFDYNRGSDEVKLPACSGEFSFEDSGYKGILDSFAKYFKIPQGNIIKDFDDYKTMMQRVAAQVNVPEFRVYFLVKGKKLQKKIDDLSLADNQKLFLGELWSARFSNYNSVSSQLNSFQVGKDEWIFYLNIKFKSK